MTTTRRLHPQLTFLAAAVVVNVVASAMAHSVTDPARHRLVACGAAFDMTITVTGLYYWLVVRPGLRPKASLLLIAFLGLLRASLAYPEIMPGKIWIGAGAELAMVAALVVGLRRWHQAATQDPVERMRSMLAGVIPFGTAARALAGELAVFYYAFAWRAKPHVPAGMRAFTLHKRGGGADLMMLIGIASLLEAAPVHLVIAHWSVKAAWIMTVLSLYGALWAVALGRSFALRPTLVGNGEILVRYGLLFSLRIPVDSIGAMGREALPGAVAVPGKTSPTLYISFNRPLEAEKMFGFTKRFNAIGLSADDAQGLEDAALALKS
ncbi:MAG: hypothetical protein ABSB15_03505 [Bryobacteraceae bacterium]|jgi:hypothetical protein